MVVGDGSQEPVTIAGDKLKNQEQLVQIGSELVMPKTVKESRQPLGDKVFEYVLHLLLLQSLTVNKCLGGMMSHIH